MVATLSVAAALLLCAAGLAKIIAPGDAAAMLRTAFPMVRRFRAVSGGVRLSGVVELGIGVAVVAVGGRLPAVLLTACYLAFLAVSLRLLRMPARPSCGCFGRATAPIGAGHVAVTAGGVGIGSAGIAQPSGALAELFDAGSFPAVVGTGQSALLAYLAFLSITALPAMNAERRRLSASAS